jgi:hypothetical protein
VHVEHQDSADKMIYRKDGVYIGLQFYFKKKIENPAADGVRVFP